MKKILSTLSLAACLLWAGSASATCSNYTTYTDGQVLTASSLNSLQTNYTNCVNAVLDGDTLTGTLNLNSAADLNIYSDTGSTLKASIDGATGTLIAGITMEGYHDNCVISVSGSTFTISGADGSSLSATNPCVTAIRSNTAGRTALAYFTANVTATFGAASDTDGNLFGITDANWASTMPMFLGETYDGTTPYWTISRLPYTVTGAAATAFCQKGDTDCDAQLDVMILTTGLTLANWVNLPITQMGWFDATYATAGGAWTFAVTTKNGFNIDYEGVQYTLPTGQMGAEAGKTFTTTDGATALTFTAINTTIYYIQHDGTTTCIHAHDDQSVAGADTTAVRWYCPFNIASGVPNFQPVGFGTGSINAVTSHFIANMPTAAPYLTVVYVNQTTSGSAIDSAFASSADTMYIMAKYPTLP